jgi:hypothetical protein
MDPLAIIIGLFILAAIINNKELSDKDAPEGNKEVRDYLLIFVVVLVLSGLGLFFGTRFENYANASLLVPLYILMIPLSIYSTGTTKVIIRVAAISILVFVILGAYM